MVREGNPSLSAQFYRFFAGIKNSRKLCMVTTESVMKSFH
jgi:hypothetical protein